MGLPNFKGKWDKKAIINPEDYANYCKGKNQAKDFGPPEYLILYFSKKTVEGALAGFDYFKDEIRPISLFRLREGEGRVALGKLSVGSPGAVLDFEEYIAAGIKKFIVIGIAGTLQKSLQIGDCALIDQAIRDEGTSYHYLPPEKYAEASNSLVGFIEKVFTDNLLKFTKGVSWTTDAPYRETEDEVLGYQREGVLTVEMELSALYSVAKYRGVEIAGCLCISDSIADLKWNPQLSSSELWQKVEKLTRLLLKSLLKKNESC